MLRRLASIKVVPSKTALDAPLGKRHFFIKKRCTVQKGTEEGGGGNNNRKRWKAVSNGGHFLYAFFSKPFSHYKK
jgi:hypothetical protein